MPILGALAGLGATFLGAQSQRKQNQRSNAFSREMYNKQYNDNLANWHRQNEYNDPSAQMARMQKAGLNPAMMYGGAGASSSGQSSSPVSTPDVIRPEFRPEDFGTIPQNIGAIADIGIKKAQTKLLQSQNTVAIQDAINKAFEGEDRKFTIGQKKRMSEWSFDALKENVRLTNQKMQDIRAKNIVVDGGGDDGKNRAQLLQNQTNTVKLKIVKLEHALREDGLSPNDPAWQKAILLAIKDPSRIKRLIRNLYRR